MTFWPLAKRHGNDGNAKMLRYYDMRPKSEGVFVCLLWRVAFAIYILH